MPTTMQNQVGRVRQVLRSTAGKIFAACWGITVLGFAGIVLFGIADRDVAGAATVGVLGVAPFVDIAMLASYWTGRACQLVARMTWLVLSVALLASTLWLLSAGKSDADLLLTYGTAILAFPLGMIAGPLTGQISLAAGQTLTVVLWTLTIGLGILQWFVLVPVLLRIASGAGTKR